MPLEEEVLETHKKAMYQALHELERETFRLQKSGQVIVLITALNVLASVASPFLGTYHVRFLIGLECVALVMSLALLGILLAFTFESRRKRGEVLFKELSDEFQWFVRFNNEVSDPLDKVRSSQEERPDLNARIALRSFAQTSDLPLIPGKFGPFAYVLLNILSSAFVVLVSRYAVVNR